MREPEEIQDEAYEQVLERVCAVDVGKASGKVCTRVPHPSRPGQRRTRVWDVEATTNAILELGEYLAGEGIEKVTLESTSDYWRIWFYLLEAAGLDVQLVNARDVKNAPGRPKTDKLDSVWQAKMTERGMLRPSFVPPVEIRQLRDYTRLRVDLTRERTRYWQRLEKLLEDSLIKVSAVASTLDTKSVRDMLEALIAGERDPKVLASLARGRMKAKRAALIEALTGRFDDHHAELTRMLLDQIDQLNAQIGRLTTRIEALIAAIPAAQGADADGTTGPSAGRGSDAAVLPAIDRLDQITGIGREGAQAIIAESGRRGALLRRAPLRTVHATRRRTRLKQAARALRVLLPRRLEDPPPQPPDVALMDPPVDGVPIRYVLRSVHRHGVQLALRLGRLDQHQRSKAHLPTSAPFRTQPPGLVSGQLSPAVDGGVDHVAAGFLSSFDHRHSLVGHPAPAAEFRSPHGRPTRQPTPGPDGISTFRTSESRPDWVPSLPRGPAVLTRPVRSLRSPLAPTSRGQALSPRSSSHLRSYPLRGVIKGLLAFTRPAFPLAW